MRDTVPTLSGNLSVEYLMRVMAGDRPPAVGSHRRDLERWASLGVEAVEDYLAWGVIERQSGAFDFSFHEENLKQCREIGLGYVVYPWIHVVPRWYLHGDQFVGARCLEHDRACAWPSIFAPATLDIYRRFYGALREVAGTLLDGICVAFPADYGEVGYPTGWASWVASLPAPFDHVHPGFWAADPHARGAFQEFLLKECDESLSGINRRFGTRFRKVSSIVPPDSDGNQELRRCFARFYSGAMTDFVDRALGVVRERFPETPLTIKLGHGGEMLCYGIEPSRLVKVAARHGARIRTTQSGLPQVHQQRIASPCDLYKVPLGSEPPAEIGRESTVARVFTDASSAVTEVFDFPEHLVGSRDLLERFQPLVKPGQPREVDVAMLFASTDHMLNPTHGFPPVLLDLADTLRDRFDFEVFDEAMVQEGALRSVRVLGVLEGRHIEPATQQAILEFARRGGTVVLGPTACEMQGPLAATLRTAPDAGPFVQAFGEAAPSMVLDVGAPGDRLRLSGCWYSPEDACQFRATPPRGETSRWCGPSASVYFPVNPDTEYLVEIDGWVHPHTVARTHSVRVNGHEIGEMERPGLQRFAAWVRADQIGNSRVAEVQLENETFRMMDLGYGEDVRELGVVAVWVRMTERDAPAVALEQAPDVEWSGYASDEVWERGVVPVGDGHLVVCREPQVVRLVSLMESAVRRHSGVAQGLVHGAFATEIPVGVRSTVFQDHLLLWNRTRTDQIVTPRAQGGEALTMSPDALAIVNRDGLRLA